MQSILKELRENPSQSVLISGQSLQQLIQTVGSPGDGKAFCDNMRRVSSNTYSVTQISSSGSAQSKTSLRKQQEAEQEVLSKLLEDQPLNQSIWSHVKIGAESNYSVNEQSQRPQQQPKKDTKQSKFILLLTIKQRKTKLRQNRTRSHRFQPSREKQPRKQAK